MGINPPTHLDKPIHFQYALWEELVHIILNLHTALHINITIITNPASL